MIRRAAESAASLAEVFVGVDTLPDLLDRRTALTPSAPAYFTRRPDGTWSPTTWLEFRDAVAAIALQFRRHGFAPGKRVGILARTSLGWETAQMAALTCGAIVAGIDPYYPDALINDLVGQLGLTALIVEDAATLARLSAANRNGFAFVAYVRDDVEQREGRLPGLGQLRSLGSDAARLDPEAKPAAAALVAFSSGSTGNPRPILYTHSQVVHACRSILDLYPELSPGTRLVCWLPLANLFQRMINFCATAKGAASYMVEDPRQVMDVVPIANPEVFVAVPRFCERLHVGMMQRVRERRHIASLVERAIALGAALRPTERGRPRMSPIRRVVAGLADRLVLARLRNVLGKRIKFIISGSAPMPRWLLDRFGAIGIPVLEAYGVSENLVPVAANRLTDCKPGTVGKPVGDNEVRIASDGEVQVRGRGVFVPTLGENSANAAALTPDGFLATGDLGSVDEEGFLTLLGRRTEAYKNSLGRWVSLTQTEAVLRQLPEVDHAAVIRMSGDRLIAVLAINQSMRGIPATEPTDAADLERRLGGTLREHLAHALRTLPGAMRPGGFLVVSRGFTPESGEITTNLKLRRAAIAEKFAEPLRRLVGDIGSPQSEAGSAPLLTFL
jgi:long-chain acyl-CoA synthetase